MKLPVTLHNEIVDFLTELPNLHDGDSQRAFIYHAGLDPQLQNQVSFGKPPAQFVPLLVSTLLKYGRLNDGQYAIEAVLKAAKHYVGQDKRTDCENLLKELRINIEKSSQMLPLKGKHSVRIFLSYVKEDKEKVEELYYRLRDAGFISWMAEKDILTGQDWKLTIQKAIQKSDFFIVCLSENAVGKKSFFNTEISEALNIWQKKKRDNTYLLPVRFDDCEVPPPLNNLQWTNLFEQNGWNHLLQAIKQGASTSKNWRRTIITTSLCLLIAILMNWLGYKFYPQNYQIIARKLKDFVTWRETPIDKKAIVSPSPIPTQSSIAVTPLSIENIKKGVVKIMATTFEGRRKVGAGFIVRIEHGAVYILTAAHVVEGGKDVEVEFFTQRNRPIPAKIIRLEGGDPQGIAASL